MTIIKRDRKTSSSDLIKSINHFTNLLISQKEDEAIKLLRETALELKTASPGTDKHNKAIRTIIDAFEGDEYDLKVYTHHRGDSKEWTEVEELCEASTRVLNLAKRFK